MCEEVAFISSSLISSLRRVVSCFVFYFYFVFFWSMEGDHYRRRDRSRSRSFERHRRRESSRERVHYPRRSRPSSTSRSRSRGREPPRYRSRSPHASSDGRRQQLERPWDRDRHRQENFFEHRKRERDEKANVNVWAPSPPAPLRWVQHQLHLFFSRADLPRRKTLAVIDARVQRRNPRITRKSENPITRVALVLQQGPEDPALVLNSRRIVDLQSLKRMIKISRKLKGPKRKRPAFIWTTPSYGRRRQRWGKATNSCQDQSHLFYMTTPNSKGMFIYILFRFYIFYDASL